jgi:hypothetical protein
MLTPLEFGGNGRVLVKERYSRADRKTLRRAKPGAALASMEIHSTITRLAYASHPINREQMIDGFFTSGNTADAVVDGPRGVTVPSLQYGVWYQGGAE